MDMFDRLEHMGICEKYNMTGAACEGVSSPFFV
jgi:hypothetical protein